MPIYIYLVNDLVCIHVCIQEYVEVIIHKRLSPSNYNTLSSLQAVVSATDQNRLCVFVGDLYITRNIFDSMT